MDSLGLGLTLDTTLLEKADKTLENMQKNSKLIMQNLTRGFTAFNEGKMGNFTQVFDDVSKAMDRLSKAKVSPDFDTKGQEKYIDRMEHLLTIVEKMSKIDNAKFFDPTEVYATDKRPDEIFAEMGQLEEYKKGLKELVDISENYDSIQGDLKKTMYTLRGEIPAQKKEVQELATSYDEAKAKQEDALKAMATQLKAFSTRVRKKDASLTDEQIFEQFSSTESMQKYIQSAKDASEQLAKAEQKLADAKEKLEQKQASLREAGKEYQSNWRVKQQEEENKLAYDNIKEREKILQKELEFSQATEAERAAMLTKRNEAEIKADQKRIRDVQKSYETLRKEIQKGEKDIANLEASRASLSKAGKDTTSVDKQLGDLYARLDKQMDLEEEFVKSNYPHIAELREKYETEAFVKAQKERAKRAQEEQKKDVSYANQFSKNAKSVEEEKQAIELLRSARNNLSKDTAHYSQIVEALNKRILSHKDHIESVTREEKEQNTLADSVINRYRKQLKALDDVNEALEKQMKIERKTSVADLDPTNTDTQALLARQKTIADDIADIESNAQGQLDVIREQHEAERAKKRIDETLRQNEREKQEYAKLLDEKYALEKQKKAMEDAGAKVGDKAYDNILKQEVELNNRISQLKAKHQKDLNEIDKKYNKKRNDDDVKAFIEAQKEKQRIAEETAKKIKENNEKYGTISKRGAAAEIETYRYAENVAQHKQAVEKLQIVRSKLDNTDKEYYQTLKKLNREIHSHELFIRAAENESVRLGNSHRGLMDISGQLMRRLALVFSVSQMTQYFRKLVEVRGQFEKTEVALTSIIQSQEKANKLMNQTIALAIKSPFTLQQLVGYTKQLAAYQVEYKDLYNTTKMLADVSAGLGVEMDRLILAFGQVKAANYLRATEVRQFTEAGFNILGELAKYYSELEGTMVSVGDVQERVTKRMVGFADVEEIFHRVTEAGGMFYEMQSKQAETLAGQWTNLQDRIDVMLNEIGTSGDGVLKFIVKMLASTIDNWEVLASSIKTAATAFIIFKTYSLLAGDGMKLLAIQMGVLTDTVPKVLSLGQAFKTLGKVVGSAVTKIGASMGALLTNPIFLAIAAIGALVSAGFSLYRHFDKMKDALKEQSDSFNEYTSSLSKLSREFGKLDKFTEKLAKLEELKGRLNERGLALSIKIDEVDAENIDKIFAENSEILQKSYDLGLSVGNAITRGLNAAQGNIFGWSLFGENLAEDAEDFAEKWNKLASYGMDAQMTAMTNEIEATIAAMNDMTEEERSAYAEMLKIYETIKDGRKAERDDKGKIIKYTESEYEWTIRRATALKQIQDLEDGSVTKNNKLARYLRQVARQERELNHEVENTVNKLAKEFGGLEELMKKAQENPVEFSAAIQAEIDKQAWDDVTKWIYSQKLHARLDIEPNYVEDPNATANKVYKGFKKDLIDARERLSKIVNDKGEGLNYQNFFISTDEIDNMKDFSGGLEEIQKLYDKNKKTIEQLEGTKDTYNKEEMARLDALQKELRAVAKLWGYDLDLNAKGGKSEALKNLKDQIKLIRDANKAYEERNKKFGKADSQAVVTDSYKEAFKEVELAIEDIDYTNLEGVVDALETLEDEAKKAGGATELLKAISEVKAEIGLTIKEKQDRELFDQVQEIFDKYELAVDIKKLNIPTELAKNLFGVDIKSFDQMRNEIISKFAGTNAEISKILSKGSVMSAEDENKLIDLIGKERVDEAKKAIEKIDDLEEKHQLERLKKYVEYAKKGVSERAKIKLEELKKLQEIEETFKVKEGDPADVKAQKEDMSKRASEKVRKESQDAMNKLEWEEFEKSDTFINIFDDIDNASTTLLNHMIGRLEEFKEQWKDMPLEDVNKIIEKLNLLQEKLAKAKPSEAAKKARDEIKAARGQIEMEGVEKIEFKDKEAKELAKKRGKGGFFAALDEEQAYQDQQKEAAQEQISLLETALRIKEGTATASDKVLQEEAKIKDMLKLSDDELKAQLKTQQGIVSNADKQNGKIQKARQSQKNLTAAQEAQREAIQDSVDMANDLYGAFKDLIDVLDADDPAMVFADMGMNILSSIPTMLTLIDQIHAATIAADGLGAAMNMAMGVVGLIVMAIQLLVQAISAAVNYAEKMRQMKLDVLAGQVDNLKKKYDALTESIEKAWSYKQLEEYSKELDKVQKKMISAQKQYVQLLRSGKGAEEIIARAEQAQRKLDAGQSVDSLSNKERKALLSEEYQDYKDATEALAEMEEDYVDQKKELLDELGGVTDPKEAAEEFVDAWLDAYKETGDGLSGLDEKFDEFFENLIKKKAAMIVAEKALTGWIDAVNNALKMGSAGDADITDEEQKVINKAAEDAKEKANKLLLGIFEGMDFSEADGLSGLQKGIQGITEQQAEILTAYWNSVRGYTASIDSKMDLILANMGVGSENNPMLDQLIAQTSVLNNIYSFLKSMTTSAPRSSQFSGLVWKSSM